MNEEEIALLNKDGTIKSKEEFLKSVESIYDEMKEKYESKTKDTYDSYLDYLNDEENIINVDDVLNTFDFLERTIYLAEEIKSEHANSVFNLIKFWNTMDVKDELPIEEREPIKIYINTPGGDLDAVFSIISSIKASKTPVYTYTIGTGYSGGFFIGICGHKRFGFPYSSFLFHEGCTMDGGDAHKFLQRTAFYKEQLNRLKEITIKNTKITEFEYENHIKDDWFFRPEDAIKYGVIDEIVTEI